MKLPIEPQLWNESVVYLITSKSAN